jgi:alpha-tubulin suppressor-like RCC1 family protein
VHQEGKQVAVSAVAAIMLGCSVPEVVVRKQEIPANAGGTSFSAGGESGEAGSRTPSNAGNGAAGKSFALKPIDPQSTGTGGRGTSSNPTAGNAGVTASIWLDGSAGTAGTNTRCGDGICDSTETQQSCCLDCGCESNSWCQAGTCISPVAITAAGFHSCVLLQDKTVECWGSNASGELGRAQQGAIQWGLPARISGLSEVTSVVAGSTFTCAIISGGTVECWGDNSSGQLGNGSVASSASPVVVQGLQDVTSIALGFDSACAILSDRTVKCWGNNDFGQLGDGLKESSVTPVSVTDLTDAVALAIGCAFSCAVISDGTAKCWGRNGDGELGVGTGVDSLVPQTVVGLTSATSLAAMCSRTPLRSVSEWPFGEAICAILTDGSVSCWGRNALGQLGNGTTKNSLKPTGVVGASDVTTLAGGALLGCAATRDGAVQCWGNNNFGQLGDGTGANSSIPVTVSGLTNVAQIAAGSDHVCALLRDSSVNCWGSNVYNNLGNDDMRSSSRPVAVKW